MNVFSELKNAQVESIADASVTDNQKGRFWMSDTLKFYDGTKTQKAVTDSSIKDTDIITLIRDAAFHVGHVITSMVDEDDFLSEYGDKWVMVKGQDLGDEADFPVLAARRPEWVTEGLITLPDARNMHLKMLPHGRTGTYEDKTSRANVPGNEQAGNVGDFSKDTLYAKADSVAGSVVLPVGRAIDIDSLLGNMLPSPQKVSGNDGNSLVENRVQNIGVNFFIKVK